MSPEGRQLIAHLRQLDAELTHQRRTRMSLRALWSAGLVGCIGLAARNWAGLHLGTPMILLIATVALALGLVYAFAPAPGAAVLAQAFDREYDLDAQMATALELNCSGQTDGLAPLITDHARRRLAFISRDVATRTSEPLRLELQTLALVCVLLAGMVLLGELSATLPTAPASDLPGLRKPAAVQPPELAGAEPEPVQEQPAPGGERPAGNQPGAGEQQLSADAQQAADALAAALRDNGATRTAAEALGRGDTQQAAEEIRKLADQADQLSTDTRSDIASALEQAANELQADQPELAQRLRQDSAKISGSDPASGLDDLARAIDDLATSQPASSAAQPPDPGSAGGQGEQGQTGENSRSDQAQPGSGGGAGNGAGGQGRTSPPADARGQEVPLPPVPNPTGPTTPGQGNGETTITLPGGSGSGGNNPGGQGGSVPVDISDPATIPAELRDAIQTYFER